MSLLRTLRARLAGEVVVVGVGNPWRADDGAGCRVAEHLRRRASGIRVIDAQDIPEGYLSDIARTAPDVVVFVDAVDLGANAGSVALLERAQIADYAPTTHRASLGLLMDLLQMQVGADVLLVAIQPECLDFGLPMTRAVASSSELVAEILAEALADIRARERSPAGTDPGEVLW
jgi:hydrogenase maturation protease